MDPSQTGDFLGRKLAKRLKAERQSENPDSSLSSSPVGAAEGQEGYDEGGDRVLGRSRRKEEAEPLDLEVLDDHDLYQHLLKVRYGVVQHGAVCHGIKQKKIQIFFYFQ